MTTSTVKLPNVPQENIEKKDENTKQTIDERELEGYGSVSKCKKYALLLSIMPLW